MGKRDDNKEWLEDTKDEPVWFQCGNESCFRIWASNAADVTCPEGHRANHIWVTADVDLVDIAEAEIMDPRDLREEGVDWYSCWTKDVIAVRNGGYARVTAVPATKPDHVVEPYTTGDPDHGGPTKSDSIPAAYWLVIGAGAWLAVVLVFAIVAW